LEETLKTREILQNQGLMTSLELMGENATTVNEANAVAEEFLRIIESVKSSPKQERVTLDLSHLGLFLNKTLCMANLRKLAKAAQEDHIDIFIGAEGMDKTDEILEAYRELSKEFANVNITVQAYLHRSKNDIENLLNNTRGKIRLVKGAYAGPKELFLERGPKLNDRYVELLQMILDAGRYCSIATNDPIMIDRITALLKQLQTPNTQYEFEMLFGVQSELLRSLNKKGHPCRQYVVYGKEWYLYLCNRISEHPDNLFRALVDIME
jgi:proline dehydrogenase